MKSQLWSEEVCDTRGLPRPFFILPKEFLEAEQKLGNKSKYPFKRIPIPWQSMPIFGKVMQTKLTKDAKGKLGLINAHEQQVHSNNLCGYCGVVIKNNEKCIRWTSVKGINGFRVMSDHLPMHKTCMKQARVYCPHMQTTEDFEFEIGYFQDLKNNAEKDVIAILQLPFNQANL